MTGVESAELAERTRQLIVECGLSVSEISRFTGDKYGVGSSYFIPERFISTIKKGVSPHLCQIVALSEVTCYSFADLMRHFGFDLRQLTRLQMKLHHDRTVLIAPSEWCSLPSSNRGRYLYAQVGRQDGMGFPEVVPGSIVRIDTKHPFVSEPLKSASSCWLCVVDHLQGLSCCYVTALKEGEILLTPHYLPCRCLQYRLGDQARIVGVVDAELRPLQNIEVPEATVSNGFERRAPIPALDDPQRLSQLIRNSRERVGFHFRGARELSARVAEELGNKDYAIAQGTLSDYEAADTVPRHISKIITLCVLYAIDFGKYLHSAGIAMNPSQQGTIHRANREPVPISLASPDRGKRHHHNSHLIRSCFPHSLIDARTEFLRSKSHSLQTYSERTRVNGDRSIETFFIVDRRATTLEESAWPASWQRPVYLVKKRDGRYAYGFCTVSDGIMTVHQPPTMNRAVERFYSREADVVGQVVAMLRGMG